MERSPNEFTLYSLRNNQISTINPQSLKLNKLRIPSDYLIQDILPIDSNRLIINGAKRIDEVYKEHTIFIYDGTDMSEIDTHKFGIVGFKMVYSQEQLFFLSDKKCQVYSLTSENYSNIPDMLSTHINPGCCKFGEGVLVVGGLNNWDIDFYDPRQNGWKNLGRLDFDVFSVACVQISDSQVLVVNYKEFFKIDAFDAKVVFHGTLPVKSKTSKIGNLVLNDDFVFCVFGASVVLKYTISMNKWTRMQKKSEGCCLLF